MRLGISPFGSSQSAVEALSKSAVVAGLDTLWLGDGYLLTTDFPGWRGAMESMTTLGWLAGRFPTARIGITAAVLPTRDMGWLAKEANTLNRIAGGGFVLAAAAGYWAHDLEARGIPFNHRGDRFRNDLADLRRRLNDEALGPGPMPSKPVPLWLAGANPTMQHSITIDVPFQASRATPEELAPLAANYFDSGGSTLCHRVRVTSGDCTVDGDRVEWHSVCGSVTQLVDAFGSFEAMGVSDLSIIPGHDDASALETIETLAASVLPQLS